MLPPWFLYAFASSFCAAMAMYMHQRLNGIGAASAVWVKILAVCVAAPVLYRTGLPTEPLFYMWTALAAAIWCINDLIYFGNVTKHGAALLARLSPLGIILSFVAWFFVKPELFGRYMDDPVRFSLIGLTLLGAALSALAVRNCPFSWNALKAIWFVIFASVAGTFLVKEAVDIAPHTKGVFGYVGIEAALMLCFYAIYFRMRDRNTAQAVFTKHGALTGLIVGGFMVSGIILRTYAQQRVDHPAYVSLISMLDVVWLMVLARMSGWKDQSNKLAGFGLVLAAAMLAVLKIR